MSDFLGALSSFGASRLFRVALSSFGWHCKLFGCDFLDCSVRSNANLPDILLLSVHLSGQTASLRRNLRPVRCLRGAPPFGRLAFGTGEGALVYGARFLRHSVQKTGFYGTEGKFGAKKGLLVYATRFRDVTPKDWTVYSS